MPPPPEKPAAGRGSCAEQFFLVYYSADYLENARGFSAFPPSIFLIFKKWTYYNSVFDSLSFRFFGIFTKKSVFKVDFRDAFFCLFVFLYTLPYIPFSAVCLSAKTSVWRITFNIWHKSRTGSLIFHPFHNTTACQFLFLMVRWAWNFILPQRPLAASTMFKFKDVTLHIWNRPEKKRF